VVKIGCTYHMWFCYRGSHSFRKGEDAYRIGYATSDDLRQWHRHEDQSSLGPAETGWDSEMVAYPAVLSVNKDLLLFYNGNSFGVEGFGLAVAALETDS